MIASGTMKLSYAPRLRVLVLIVAVAFVWLAAETARAQPAGQQPQPPSAGQSEFIPVKELPQAEQIPAARLVIAAYLVVWVALLVFVWSVWRRVSKVQRELESLNRRLQENNRRL